MRQLSDLALMLGDYETASSTLRLLASDTKADRAYKAYAGVQEALGAAAVMMGAPPPDAIASYKEALHRYAQVGGDPRMHRFQALGWHAHGEVTCHGANV
jgi:hypothetical protein